MPPKKTKGRKRASHDDIDESEKQLSDSASEHTDLLSPSEVVKMRKKTRPSTQANSPNPTTRDGGAGRGERETSTRSASKVVKSSRVMERNSRKEMEKRKENAKSKRGGEKENENNKRTSSRGSKRQVTKKKPKTEDESEVSDLPETILYPCGICTKEVSDADDAILCEAGCEYWYHRNCTGMTDIAYQLLTNEDNAEWVCDKCIATKSVPLVKLKGE